MLEILTIVTPVFGLIGVGYLAGRFGILRPETGTGISDFAFTIAMPSLLFRNIATANLGNTDPVGVLIAFFGAAWTVWIISSVVTHFVLKRPAADAPAIAINAVFGNTLMLGLPLSFASFGDEAAGPIAVILGVHAALLWMTASVHMEWVTGGGDSGRVAGVVQALIRDITRNPIIIGVLAGVVWRLSGVTLPGPIEKTLALLTQAGVPTALVALGLTLVSFQIKGEVPTLISIVSLKLVVMPALAWLIAVKLLHLSPVAAGVVVTFAAVPTGANAFLFSTRYDRAVNASSGAVALGTVLAAVTVSVVLSVLHR